MSVEVTEPDDPLVASIDPFTVEDEPYILELTGPARVLLGSRFSGSNPGYVLSDWPDPVLHPQMYLREHGAGAVLYLALGHSSGKYDFRPLMDEGPVTRGPWDSPPFREIVSRALRWVVAQ
jgi:hypothetical protein